MSDEAKVAAIDVYLQDMDMDVADPTEVTEAAIRRMFNDPAATQAQKTKLMGRAFILFGLATLCELRLSPSWRSAYESPAGVARGALPHVMRDIENLLRCTGPLTEAPKDVCSESALVVAAAFHRLDRINELLASPIGLAVQDQPPTLYMAYVLSGLHPDTYWAEVAHVVKHSPRTLNDAAGFFVGLVTVPWDPDTLLRDVPSIGAKLPRLCGYGNWVPRQTWTSLVAAVWRTRGGVVPIPQFHLVQRQYAAYFFDEPYDEAEEARWLQVMRNEYAADHPPPPPPPPPPPAASKCEVM